MSTQHSINLDLFDAVAEPVLPEIAGAVAHIRGIEERADVQSSCTEIHPAMTFNRIEIATETIKRFVEAYPGHASALNRAFMSLRWEIPGPVPDELYRAHAEELLQRVLEHESLEVGTRAEALIALSKFSLRGPLVPQYAALSEKLFLEIFGPESIPGGGPMLQESWQGASEQLLNELLQRIRVPSRQLQ
jgi:hypothetical protein